VSSRPALLLVDVQRDYLARAGLTPDARSLVDALSALLAWARAQGWPVFHVQTRVAADGSDWMPHWRATGRALCIDGTPGAEPPAGLEPLADERVVRKRFFSAFENPELLPALRARKIDTVIVAGVHTHACVRSAVLDAYANGFEVLVPTDAVGSYDPAHAELTLEWLNGRAATCLPTAELTKRFG
jgi:nicotinamidase-related amidase